MSFVGLLRTFLGTFLVILLSVDCVTSGENVALEQEYDSKTSLPVSVERVSSQIQRLERSPVAFSPTSGSLGQDDQQGPKFVVEPSSRVDFSNSSYGHVDCVASGVPPPTVHWVYANGTVASDVHGYRRLFKNGTMVFMPFRGDDYRPQIHAAVYKCIAHNAVGSIVSRGSHVRAVVNQYYDVQVHDEFVIFGNTAVLKCHIPSFVKDYVRVTAWLKQEQTASATSTATKDGSDSGSSSSVHLARLVSGGRYVHTPAGELHILTVDVKDGQSTYSCETLHQLTGQVKVSSPGKIIVTEVHNSVTPRIAHSVPIVHAYQGDTVQLSCEAQGFPVPTNRWYRTREKEPMPIASNERIREMFSFLSIDDVQLTDDGLYRCVVTNSVGEERTDTVLRVRARLRIQVIPESQTVDVGRAATLTCTTSGHPVPTVSWLKNGQPLPIGGHRTLVTPWILRIENVGKEDRGMYQCFAHNGDDEAQGSAEIKLGDVLPILESSFSELTVQPGSIVSLECVSSGQPFPRFHWTLDDTPLPTRDVRYRVRDSVDDRGKVVSSVNITGVQVTDSGQFTCLATNKAGSVQHSAKVNVVGRPMIRPMPNMSAVAGTTTQIICRVLGYPIHSITWEMAGTSLPTNRRQQVLTNGTLFIHDVSKSLDEGVYKCVAKSPQGESASRTVTVTVLVPPLIDPFTFPRLLYEGMRARISCVVTEGDFPIAFSWLKDGHSISANLDVTIRQDDHFSSSITFPSITPLHSGNYSCIARNTAATVNYTATLIVNVPPRWLIQPSDQSTAFHSTVSFDCRAEGTPTPKITWKKAWGERRGPEDYRDVTQSSSNARVLVNNTLLLERVTEQDEGYYLCDANNGVGTGLSKVIYLTVHAAAYFDTKMTSQNARWGHSAHLTCVAKGDMPISISWTSNGLTVDTNQNPRFTIRERKRSNALESELIVTKVQRTDTGMFKCLASNAFGQDETIVSLVVQEPPDAPDKVRVIDHGSRTVQLEWIGSFDGNSPLLGYVIQYKLSAEDWRSSAQNVTVDTTNSRVTVHGLLPGTSYNLRVIARNAIGQSESSNSVVITTNEEAPGGPPLQVEAFPLGPQSLKVTWKPPRNEYRNGEVLGYYVGYKVYDSSEPYVYETVAVTRGAAEEILLKTLRKYTKYSVTVKAFNGIGTGPSSDEIVAFTSEDVPSEPPQNVRCSSLGTQSIHVRWDPPPIESQNGILKGYKIFYNSLSTTSERYSKEAKYVVISAKSQETSLTGLDKYTNYSIQVTALTQVGDGAKSDNHYCRTREDVPGAPSEVKALISSATSVLIVWRSPKRPNGVLSKYNLYWSPAQDSHKRAMKLNVPSHGDLSYDVQGLVENARYEFWVTASTNVGEGESTSVVSQTPHHKVPARIASFSQVATVPYRSNALLPCLAVGSPVPRRIWQSRGRMIMEDDRFRHLQNGTLVIQSVQRHDVGNYSCRIENLFGADEVSHELLVLAPPLAPHLLAHKTTETSIVLSWKSREDSGYPVLFYRLKYKRDFGGWEEISVDADQDHVVLKNLHCGTRYQICLQAENDIGPGEISKMINVATKGSVPRIPAQVGVLRVNLTSVTLRLVGWPDGGCPVRHFVVQYRSKDQKDYILVSNNVIPEHESITIGDLRTGVTYVLHITAHNDAGSVAGEYEFSTSSYHGELAADDAKMSRSTMGLETSVIMAVLVPAFLVVLVLIVICVVLRRKKYRRYQQSVLNSIHHRRDYQNPSESGTLEKRQLQSVSANHSFETPPDIGTPSRRSNKRANIIHDDVCPYATFNLSRGRSTSVKDPIDHMNLHTFSEDEAALNQHSVRYVHDNSRQSQQQQQHVTKEQYSFLMASSPPPPTTKTSGLTGCNSPLFASSSTNDILKCCSNDDDDDDDRGENYVIDGRQQKSEYLTTVLYGTLLGDRSLPRHNHHHRHHHHQHQHHHHSKLTYLTESAVQLFEQTRVPDLLFHERDREMDWEEDYCSERSEKDDENVKVYSELRGSDLSENLSESSGYQLYGIVR